MTDRKTMEYLWGANVIRRNGFYSFPLLLLRVNDYLAPSKRLLPNEEKVLHAIVSYRTHGFIPWPKSVDLKRDTGIEPMYAIRAAIEGLSTKGFIRVVHVPGLSGKKIDHYRYDLRPCVEILRDIAKTQPNSKRRHLSVKAPTQNAVEFSDNA